MNPDTPELPDRLEANPALLSGTTSIWMDGGGTEQQQVVAEACIREAVSGWEAGSALDAEGLTASLQGLHHVAAQYTVTAPHHFAALLRQSLQVFGSKRADILEQIDFLQVCSARLCRQLCCAPPSVRSINANGFAPVSGAAVVSGARCSGCLLCRAD